MNSKQVKVDFLLNKITSKDKLFGGEYTVDPYQNCEFGCRYCDSSFDKTIYIKSNAVELLEEELKDAIKGTIIVGSVHDPYQRLEKELQITRDILDIIKQNDFSCHILTKSNLVLRDLDIISKITNCTVTISLTALDQKIWKIFESNVPSPLTRLNVIEKLNDQGIKTGLAVIPTMPFITENELEDIIKSAAKHNAQYALHKHLELKGDQKICFFDIIDKHFPDLSKRYEMLYRDNYMPNNEYILKISDTINKLCNKYKIKNEI